MLGNRRYPGGDRPVILDLGEGDYAKAAEGVWLARAPGVACAGSLEKHEVVENADGTITVSPSILMDDGRRKWHGYLISGIWVEC